MQGFREGNLERGNRGIGELGIGGIGEVMSYELGVMSLATFDFSVTIGFFKTLISLKINLLKLIQDEKLYFQPTK